MTKYSNEFKIQIVSEFFDHQNSMTGLSKKYNVPLSMVRTWIHQTEENGLDSLKVKHKKMIYSPEFKLNVIRYYLNNPNLGKIPVATKFNINVSQVYTWVKKFKKEGMAGLLPKQKGRPSKMPKKTKKKQAQKIKLSEKQKYEEKIIKQEAEIEKLKLENLGLKKSGCPISSLSNKEKTRLILDIRAEQPQVKLQILLSLLNLNRKTYYDNKNNRLNKPDKYAKVKERIKAIYYGDEGRETYGYRPMWGALRDEGIYLAQETVRKLMRMLGIKTTLYHKNTGKYSSYKGSVGKKAPNILKQKFDEKIPYRVLHTDVTEVKLTTGKKVYISPVVDEASLEILACCTSYSPEMKTIYQMLDELEEKLPKDANPILHSDQGFQYQNAGYQARLKEMNITQSMSRKGNCHDNAPGETIFNLLKRERLNREKISTLEEMKEILKDYIYWFNNIRRSNKLKYTTPVKYRNRVLANNI
ncbi:IS3 family transposase [Lactobacillus sp. PV034]|uniref:IS3 family transposase n=1 Tax=Lactobacillus sp. PV034 TaxID=2594495 RepID=UPI00223F56FD|nr:IS3 family transposase [Lactobacillus sp. PV034]QNQ80689.1 IS3 family transposase [Lactobacillus sp. PV034]QNQ80880.1 IS3 family transposase [Lactobacillus sp. PV034]